MDGLFNDSKIINLDKISVKFYISFENTLYIKNLLSITSFFYSAVWLEREIFDFFGLYFFFNKDLRRILLDYGFIGNPLRKNFPLSGFIELFYDDSIKKIVYEKVTLCQEYRSFVYLNEMIIKK